MISVGSTPSCKALLAHHTRCQRMRTEAIDTARSKLTRMHVMNMRANQWIE